MTKKACTERKTLTVSGGACGSHGERWSRGGKANAGCQNKEKLGRSFTTNKL